MVTDATAFQEGDTVLFNRAGSPFVTTIASIDSPTQITATSSPTVSFTTTSITVVERNGNNADVLLQSKSGSNISLDEESIELTSLDTSGSVGATLTVDDNIVVRSKGGQSRATYSNTAGVEIISITGVTDISSNNQVILEYNNGSASGAKITLSSSGINFTGIQVFSDDTSAGAAGLASGDLYKTSDGNLRIKN